MCDNYTKYHRELFRKWIETYHSGALLLHIDRASVSREDLAVEGVGEVYMNHPYWIELLDKRLRTPGDNIQQENIFIVLSSLEMMMFAQFSSIIRITICLMIRWLAGNFHNISYYNWSVCSMGIMVEELETELKDIKE